MKVCQAFAFEAAHRLPNVPDGHRCKNMHGHSYRLELTIDGKIDPVTGFVVDFFEVEAMMRPILQQLDHKLLNDIIGLENPTAENIVLWIKKQLDGNEIFRPLAWTIRKITDVHVRVYETPMCWAEA